MKLENFTAGMRFANYRKLCDHLQEPVCAGNSKTAQLRKWRQYFAYERDKNAFIITEVYSTPHSLDDERRKYAKHLIPILLSHLSVFECSEHSFENWFVLLGMFEDTIFNNEKREEIRIHMELTPFHMQKLLHTVDSVCRRTLLKTLSILQKEQIIAYSVNEHIVIGGAHRKATAEEQKQIQLCKTQAMAEVGADSMFVVQINPVRRMRFYEALNSLYKEQFGWDRTYSLLEIMPLNQAEVEKYRDVDVRYMREALNHSIKSAVISQLRSECDKAEQKSMEEWEADSVTDGFKLDHMTTELFVHILENEI